MGKPNTLLQHADHSDGADDNHDTTLLQPTFFTIRALKGITIKGAERDLLHEIHGQRRMDYGGFMIISMFP